MLYNTNFFNCITLDRFSESKRDYILVEVEKGVGSMSNGEFFSSLLHIEPYSFYKEDVEFVFAPYSKFIVELADRETTPRVIKLRHVMKPDFIRLYL